MTAHPSVGVYHQLTPCKPTICFGSSRDKAARRIDIVEGIIIEEIFGYYAANKAFHIADNLVIGDGFGVLSRKHYSVDADGLVF